MYLKFYESDFSTAAKIIIFSENVFAMPMQSVGAAEGNVELIFLNVI